MDSASFFGSEDQARSIRSALDVVNGTEPSMWGLPDSTLGSVSESPKDPMPDLGSHQLEPVAPVLGPHQPELEMTPLSGFQAYASLEQVRLGQESFIVLGSSRNATKRRPSATKTPKSSSAKGRKQEAGPQRPKPRDRTEFSPEALQRMVESFEENPYPGIEERTRLARLAGVEEGRIQVWFQNRRARHGRNKKPSPPDTVSSTVKTPPQSTAVATTTTSVCQSKDEDVRALAERSPQNSEEKKKMKSSRRRGQSVESSTPVVGIKENLPPASLDLGLPPSDLDLPDKSGRSRSDEGRKGKEIQKRKVDDETPKSTRDSKRRKVARRLKVSPSAIEEPRPTNNDVKSVSANLPSKVPVPQSKPHSFFVADILASPSTSSSASNSNVTSRPVSRQPSFRIDDLLRSDASSSEKSAMPKSDARNSVLGSTPPTKKIQPSALPQPLPPWPFSPIPPHLPPVQSSFNSVPSFNIPPLRENPFLTPVSYSNIHAGFYSHPALPRRASSVFPSNMPGFDNRVSAAFAPTFHGLAGASFSSPLPLGRSLPIYTTPTGLPGSFTHPQTTWSSPLQPVTSPWFSPAFTAKFPGSASTSFGRYLPLGVSPVASAEEYAGPATVVPTVAGPAYSSSSRVPAPAYDPITQLPPFHTPFAVPSLPLSHSTPRPSHSKKSKSKAKTSSRSQKKRSASSAKTDPSAHNQEEKSDQKCNDVLNATFIVDVVGDGDDMEKDTTDVRDSGFGSSGNSACP